MRGWPASGQILLPFGQLQVVRESRSDRHSPGWRRILPDTFRLDSFIRLQDRRGDDPERHFLRISWQFAQRVSGVGGALLVLNFDVLAGRRAGLQRFGLQLVFGGENGVADNEGGQSATARTRRDNERLSSEAYGAGQRIATYLGLLGSGAGAFACAMLSRANTIDPEASARDFARVNSRAS